MSFVNPDPTAPAAHRTSGAAAARAEYPPQGYWRRWCADAAAPSYPQLRESAPPDTAAVAAADSTPRPALTPLAEGEPPYRVVIVEDDPSQALFAESILGGAGIEARVVSSPSETMAVLDDFHPDLVLTDLHMPGMSGRELIAQIRAHKTYAHMPVVFLTGDTDPERHFELLDIGADDYLSKPVRPRHLIAAVQNRVQRARALRKQRDQDVRRHPITGLLTRTYMLQQLSAAFPQQRRGALHFLVVEGTDALRNHYGYATLDAILSDAGRLIEDVSGGRDATRLNDNTFLVYSPDLPSDRHADWARELRDSFGRHPFEANNETLHLRVCIGYVDLASGFSEAGAALAAAEEALRLARTHSNSIAAYEKPAEDAATAATPSLTQALQTALDNDALELYFQPIVAVVGGDDVQYQTLVRLTESDGKLRTAAEILPLAERIGRLQDLDRLVLTQAIAALQVHAINRRPARLFVPQAVRTLGQPDYGSWLLAALETAEIPPAQLVIDTRLGDALVHPLRLQAFCQQMVDAGVRLCLSQYQSGSEADALLARLPLDYVRLAAHYTQNIEKPAVQGDLRGAIDRIHRLGFKVIGQQVEDAKTAAAFWLSGIDYLQGDLVQSAASDMDFDFQHSLL